MKVHKPESIKEAIRDLQMFLDCDLYTKLRPEERLPLGKKGKMETWVRKDTLKDMKDFEKYLEGHFSILRKQIIRLIGKKKYSAKNNEMKVKGK